jgi:hypothetical protein
MKCIVQTIFEVHTHQNSVRLNRFVLRGRQQYEVQREIYVHKSLKCAINFFCLCNADSVFKMSSIY